MTEVTDHTTIEATGACLCGKVSYQAEFRPSAGACHCGMCRKWCGGPLMSIHAVGPVSFKGAEHIGTYSSSAWAERGFCNHCGSGLYYHLLPQAALPDGEYIMSAGTLTDQSRLVFDHEVYVDHAPGWYHFAGEEQRKRMTEADIMAIYGASD